MTENEKELKEEIGLIQQGYNMQKGSAHRYLLRAHAAILHISDEDKDLRRCEKLITAALDIITGRELPIITIKLKDCERCSSPISSTSDFCQECEEDLKQYKRDVASDKYDKEHKTGLYAD